MPYNDTKPSFSETQRFTQLWIWLLVLVVVAIGWWSFYEQIIRARPFGEHPAPDALVWVIFVLFGLALPVFFRSLKLVTEVHEDHVHIRYFPLHSRTIFFSEMKSAAARTYRPIVEYGGWGIRWSPTNGMAYNVSGNKGVQLELTSGKRVLIGSQRADELERALRARL